jgi:hypothetical protein
VLAGKSRKVEHLQVQFFFEYLSIRSLDIKLPNPKILTLTSAAKLCTKYCL